MLSVPKYSFVQRGDSSGGEVGIVGVEFDCASNGAKKSTAFSAPSGCTASRTIDSPRFAGGELPGVGCRRRAAVAGAR